MFWLVVKQPCRVLALNVAAASRAGGGRGIHRLPCQQVRPARFGARRSGRQSKRAALPDLARQPAAIQRSGRREEREPLAAKPPGRACLPVIAACRARPAAHTLHAGALRGLGGTATLPGVEGAQTTRPVSGQRPQASKKLKPVAGRQGPAAWQRAKPRSPIRHRSVLPRPQCTTARRGATAGQRERGSCTYGVFLSYARLQSTRLHKFE